MRINHSTLKTFRSFALALGFTLSVFALDQANAKSAKQPNIIIIMADDMGYGGVSCYDNQYFETPEIDRLAQDGIKLTDFHSNGAVCSPTRSAFITGRYPQRSGIDEVVNADPMEPAHQKGIQDSEWTFPEAMKTAGYVTGAFGKWHLGYKLEFNPTLHGFDEFKGFVSGNIDAQSHLDRMDTQDWWDGTELKDEPGYHTDLITENALDFIDRHQEEPFFLYLPHGTPHSPHQARASKIQRGPNKGQIPEWAPDETYSDIPGADDWMIRHFILPLDESVGRIRAKLEELGIAENTVLWFVSDNGGTERNFTMSELTRGGKNTFFEGGHRVPGIVWAPGQIKEGTVSDETIMTFDIMPTSMALAGVEAPKDHKLDGIDVSKAIFKEKSLPHTVRFWNMYDRGALRDGKWKLYINADEQLLFNLDDDPQETTDLSSKNPERAENMRKVYDSMVKETRASSPYATAK